MYFMKSLSTPSFTTRKKTPLGKKGPKDTWKQIIFLYSGVTALVEGAQFYSFSNLLYGLSESWRRPVKQKQDCIYFLPSVASKPSVTDLTAIGTPYNNTRRQFLSCNSCSVTQILKYNKLKVFLSTISQTTIMNRYFMIYKERTFLHEKFLRKTHFSFVRYSLQNTFVIESSLQKFKHRNCSRTDSDWSVHKFKLL